MSSSTPRRRRSVRTAHRPRRVRSALLAAGLAAALAASLSACAASSNDPPTTTVSTAAATTPATTTTTTAGTTTTTGATTVPTTTTTTNGGATTVPGVTPAGAPAATTATGTEQLAPPLGARLTRFFSSDSPWNTQVQHIRVDPRSAKMLDKARVRTAARELPNGTLKPIRRRIKVGLTVNVKRWTVPIFSDRGGVPTPATCRQAHCGPDAVTSIVLPPHAAPNPSFDGWMTVIDSQARRAFDFWRARREPDGSVSYQFVKAWNLDGPGYQAPGGVSARGSGLPLFAGVIRPDEIRAGRIDHALSISVPGAAQLRYVQPASSTDGNGARTSLPEGARIRLKPGAAKLLTHRFVRSPRERRTAGTIIQALQRYGAIVVDRSAAPTLYAQRNAHWRGRLPLNLLQDIKLTQFQVLRLPKELNINRREHASRATAPTGSPGVAPASNTFIPGPATNVPTGGTP